MGGNRERRGGGRGASGVGGSKVLREGAGPGRIVNYRTDPFMIPLPGDEGLEIVGSETLACSLVSCLAQRRAKRRRAETDPLRIINSRIPLLENHPARRSRCLRAVHRF